MVERIVTFCSQHFYDDLFQSITCTQRQTLTQLRCSVSHKLKVLHVHNFLIPLIFVMFIILTLHRMLHCVLLYIPVDTKHRVGRAWLTLPARLSPVSALGGLSWGESVRQRVRVASSQE